MRLYAAGSPGPLSNSCSLVKKYCLRLLSSLSICFFTLKSWPKTSELRSTVGKPGLSWTDRSAPVRTNSERREAEISAGAMDEEMY